MSGSFCSGVFFLFPYLHKDTHVCTQATRQHTQQQKQGRTRLLASKHDCKLLSFQSF